MKACIFQTVANPNNGIVQSLRKQSSKNADFQRAKYWQFHVRHELGEMRFKMSVTPKRGTRWRTLVQLKLRNT